MTQSLQRMEVMESDIREIQTEIRGSLDRKSTGVRYFTAAQHRRYLTLRIKYWGVAATQDVQL